MATITARATNVKVTKKVDRRNTVRRNPGHVKQTPKFVETVGGRLAMQGLTWGGATRLMMNERFQDQLSDPHNLMTAAAVTTLVTVASLITEKDVGHESYYAWTPDAETLNGRTAMVGILAAMLVNV